MSIWRNRMRELGGWRHALVGLRVTVPAVSRRAHGEIKDVTGDGYLWVLLDGEEDTQLFEWAEIRPRVWSEAKP
jgi:hypothetical protein